MSVQRCADIDRSSPITNIYVDDIGNKWVGDFKGVYLAQSPDYAKAVKTPANEWALLSVPDGNAELNLAKADLQSALGDAFSQINTAVFDAKKKELWIGTTESGVFRLKTEPNVQLIEEINSSNTKLKTDFINTIFIKSDGEIWIGSEEGAIAGNGNSWRLVEKFYDVLAFAEKDNEIYMLSDGEILQVDSRDKTYILTIDESTIEGDIKDFTFDSKGRMWYASEVVVRYDFDNEKYDVFGPIQEFTSQFVNTIAVDNDDALWVGTDDKGVYFIGQESSMSVTVVVDEALSCQPGANNASLSVRASGGEPPYSYEWNNQTINGDKPKGLSAGEYIVTVTDSKGKKMSATAILTDISINLEVKQAGLVTNGTSDGKANVKVAGGEAPYTFEWDNGETDRSATKLTAGTHQVTVTDKAGCSAVASVELQEAVAEMAVTLEKTSDIKCAGATSGGLKAIVTGGREPFTYRWNIMGLKGSDVEGLAEGTYLITVTDARGKKVTGDYVFETPAAFEAIIKVDAAASAGAADGQATVSIPNGSGNYTYVWSTGATTATVNELEGGTHTVTVSDENGCTAVAEIEMEEDVLPLAITVKQTAAIDCGGGSTAAIEVSVEGGKEPFEYRWNGEKSRATAENLPAGKYRIVVRDAAGNEAAETVNVESPEPITAAITPNTPATTNNADGQATVKVEGGSAPYTYAWSNGETTAIAKKLDAGEHSVTITDANGCTVEDAINIGEDILPLEVVINQTSENNCPDDTNAAVTVAVNGGKPPYQYQWDNADFQGESIENMAAGNYLLTVTDAIGTEQTAQVSIAGAVSFSVEVTVTANATTGNSDGQATASLKNGGEGFTYEWDNGETTATAEKLAPGEHQVTVTNANGCTEVSNTIRITEDILPLSVAIQQTANNNCNGATDAALKVEVSGGKGPFEYVWSDNNLTGKSVGNIAAGDYTVSITDTEGSTETAQITIEEPNALIVSISPKSPASTGKEDGKAKAKVEGGQGNYTYTWDNGETNETAEKLAPGTRTVTVTDENGCTATATIDISEDILPLAVEINQTTENKCQGNTNATLAVEVSGGKAPFEYTWNEENLTGAAVTELGAGTYTVTIKDAEGNSSNASITLEDPLAINATITPKSPASTGKEDGSAKVKADGGTGKLTYTWDNGETGETAKKLAPGTHVVTVTDENGCSVEANIEITEDILPLAIEINPTQTNNCNGASDANIAVEVSGGKAPFDYAWSDSNLSGDKASNLSAGNYSVTVTDTEGTSQTATITLKEPEALIASININASATTDNADGQATVKVEGGAGDYTYTWDNGEKSAKAEKLAPGIRSVTITDKNGCTTSAEVEITEDILPLAATIDVKQKIDCAENNNASFTVEVSGGKKPFTYQWARDGLSGQQQDNLPAGDYNVTVTDAVGTTATAQITINNPESLDLTANVVNPASTNNEDGKAVAVAKGGTGDYTYAWDNGETLDAASKLAPGNHSVTVTDANGCTATVSIDISENIQELTFGFQQTSSINCFGAATAGLKVAVKGGKAPFEYTWSDSSLSGSDINNLAAGTYAVTVSDVSGQSLDAEITIEEPAELDAILFRTRAAFDEDADDGLAEIKVTGGKAPYTYAWSNGETNSIAKELTVGLHTVTVTDANGCTDEVTLEIRKKLLQALRAGRLRAGQILRLNNLNFPADSTDMTPESLPILEEVQQFLIDNPSITLEVGGHTNSTPPAEYCDRLSTARAKNVATYIVQGSDIDPNRVTYVGYGKRKPIATNKTEDGRKRNQRVEIKVLTL